MTDETQWDIPIEPATLPPGMSYPPPSLQERILRYKVDKMCVANCQQI